MKHWVFFLKINDVKGTTRADSTVYEGAETCEKI